MGIRGQSVVEYLVIAAALVVVVLALAPAIDTKARELMTQARTQIVSPAATADAIIPPLP